MVNAASYLQAHRTNRHFEWEELVFFVAKAETTVSIATPHIHIMRVCDGANVTVPTENIEN